MEILDIPEKLQQAILNPDKRLTVDLRVCAVWEFLTAADSPDKRAVSSIICSAKWSCTGTEMHSPASQQACSCQTAHPVYWGFQSAPTQTLASIF